MIDFLRDSPRVQEGFSFERGFADPVSSILSSPLIERDISLVSRHKTPIFRNSRCSVCIKMAYPIIPFKDKTFCPR